MKNRNIKNLAVTLALFGAFVIFTLLLGWVDVAQTGPMGSSVGFSSVNKAFCELVGVNMTLYTITDWASIGALFIVFCFGALGLAQLLTRRSLIKVDKDILILGAFYMVTAAVYIFFELNPVNFRPVLIDGYLEASYPSSTTLLVLCVTAAAMLQVSGRVKKKAARRTLSAVLVCYGGLMVIGRLLSGVHYLTDIIGGILVSSALVMGYYSACRAYCR